MLEQLDDSIEAFFRAAVPLGATDVDVSFEAPDREWSAKLTRPTVNIFLWDIRRSSERSRTGFEEFERDGVRLRRMALPTIELRYLVTAWTAAHDDERGLLGGIMRALLRHPQVPDDFLPGSLRDQRPPALLMTRSGEDHIDVFRALDGQLKPGVNMIVVTDVDTGTGEPLAPSVGEIGVSVGDLNGTARSTNRRVAGDVAIADAVGCVVRGPSDATTVNASGRFLLRAAPGDEIVLETTPPRTATVPESGGIRFT